MKKSKKKRARRAAVPKPAPEAATSNGGEQTTQRLDDEKVSEMLQAAHRVAEQRGRENGKRIERAKLLDGICARIAFYEATKMKPVTMTISWHEAVVILEALQANSHGVNEQRALATQMQWRVLHDGNDMVASRGP